MSDGHRILLIHPGIYDTVDPHIFPPWGILTISETLAAAGASTACYDLNGRDPVKSVHDAIDTFRPSAVGFTGKLGNSARRMREAIDAIRQEDRRIPIAVGGPLVSSYPDLKSPIWSGVDALFWGDGEETMVDWVLNGYPSGAFYGPSEIASLDPVGIPVSWEELGEYVKPAEYWPNMGVLGMHVSAARGCTRRCTFCYLNAQYPSRSFRFISASRLAHDLDRLHEKLDVTGFYFVDDCFLDKPPVRAREFCTLMVNSGSLYRFGCDIQLPDLEQVDLLREMHAAGFRSLYLGLEAASDDVRRRLGKGSLRGDTAATANSVLDLGYVIRASIGIGWPGETADDIEATLRLIDSIPGLVFDAYRYLPLPGVPLTQYWTRRGHGRLEEIAVDYSPYQDYSEYNRNYSGLSDDQFEGYWREMQLRQNDRLEKYFTREAALSGGA